MAVRRIVRMGNPVLRKVAAPIPEKDIKSPKIQTLIQDMIDTMFDYDGRGLAAPQVAESLKLVVMVWDFEPKKKPYLLVLVNPEIEILTEETSTHWEGCLSVPGLRGRVTRPNRISVKSLDAEGKKQDFIADGFAATVVQHECDHLQGKLYIDRLDDSTFLSFNREHDRYLSSDSDEPVHD